MRLTALPERFVSDKGYVGLPLQDEATGGVRDGFKDTGGEQSDEQHAQQQVCCAGR
jgi:hypothetical protein